MLTGLSHLWSVNMCFTDQNIVDEKNRVIFFLAIMFTPNSSFCVISVDDSRKLVTVWAKYLCAPEISHRVLSENGIANRPWGYRL